MSDLSKWLHGHLGLPEVNLNKFEATSQIVGQFTNKGAAIFVAALDDASFKALAAAVESRKAHELPAPAPTPESGQ